MYGVHDDSFCRLCREANQNDKEEVLTCGSLDLVLFQMI